MTDTPKAASPRDGLARIDLDRLSLAVAESSMPRGERGEQTERGSTMAVTFGLGKETLDIVKLARLLSLSRPPVKAASVEEREAVARFQGQARRLREEANMDDRAATSSRNPDSAATFRAWATQKREFANDIDAVLSRPAPAAAGQAERTYTQAEVDALMAAAFPDVPHVDGFQDPHFHFFGGRIINRATFDVIPPDEPVFVFRARDLFALRALRSYAAALDHSDAPPERRASLQERIGAFVRFGMDHPRRMKVPGA